MSFTILLFVLKFDGLRTNCRHNCNLDADQVPYQIELYYYLYMLMWDGVSHLINKQIYVSPTVTYP